MDSPCVASASLLVDSGSECGRYIRPLMPPSRRALMTIRSQEPHDTPGVGATGPLFRFILRRSDLFPSAYTH